jgi:2-aminoadipate transaminase
MVPEALAEQLAHLAAQGRVPKFLYVIPNHQNPAGVSMSLERRHAVLDLAQRHDLLVVEDNPYGLLDFKGEIRPALRTLAPERVLYVGTLSKIFSPGIRVGWVAAPESIRDRLILLKEAADLCQSNLTQYVAERWFATQPWTRQVEEYREVYRERCSALLEAVASEFPASCTFTEPTGGFFVWVRLPNGVDSGELLAKAINARVAYVPGRGFFADGSGGNYLRLSFCFPPADVIREGARRLGEVLHAEVELLRAFYGGEDRA